MILKFKSAGFWHYREVEGFCWADIYLDELEEQFEQYCKIYEGEISGEPWAMEDPSTKSIFNSVPVAVYTTDRNGQQVNVVHVLYDKAFYMNDKRNTIEVFN